MELYNCRKCKQMNRIKDNICFRYNKKDRITIKVPVEDGITFKQVEREVGFKDVMPLLNKLYRWFPEEGVFHQFLYLFEKESVCPVPFMRSDLEELIILQDHCERYSCLPFGTAGTLEEQPAWLMDAFTIVVATKNEFDRHRLQKGNG